VPGLFYIGRHAPYRPQEDPISDVFAHLGALLPADFSVFPTFRIHAAPAVILATVLAAHAAAAL
jgi:hypothetical protein